MEEGGPLSGGPPFAVAFMMLQRFRARLSGPYAHDLLDR